MIRELKCYLDYRGALLYSSFGVYTESFPPFTQPELNRYSILFPQIRDPLCHESRPIFYDHDEDFLERGESFIDCILRIRRYGIRQQILSTLNRMDADSIPFSNGIRYQGKILINHPNILLHGPEYELM
jgi:hypothetical protein